MENTPGILLFSKNLVIINRMFYTHSLKMKNLILFIHKTHKKIYFWIPIECLFNSRKHRRHETCLFIQLFLCPYKNEFNSISIHLLCFLFCLGSKILSRTRPQIIHYISRTSITSLISTKCILRTHDVILLSGIHTL